uniref:TRPC5 opposite strand protein n=1 Tax=Heterocephalus glaber TaxID=10181 RepID=A0A0P6IWQ4_HETGA
MEPVSFPVLVGGLTDCISQLIRIAEAILHFITQQQQVPRLEQNNRVEQVEESAASADEPPLPDLANFSDLESILSLRDDEDLVLDVDQALLVIGDINEDILLGIDSNSRKE